jgi:hypothetical protein
MRTSKNVMMEDEVLSFLTHPSSSQFNVVFANEAWVAN